jgi:hypothetical protein
MRNYGEELVYWYFRLNGFIPMADFVLHDENKRIGSDCDLVAVRFPHVYETIGGQLKDWDRNLLKMLGYDGERILASFIQVKAGEGDGGRIGEINAYFEKHLVYLVNRLGCWPADEAEEIADRFVGRAVLEHGNYVLSKVTILRTLRPRRTPPQYIEVGLDTVIQFIMNRMRGYAADKFRDRFFFPDAIIQLIADQAQTPELRWPTDNKS